MLVCSFESLALRFLQGSGGIHLTLLAPIWPRRFNGRRYSSLRRIQPCVRDPLLKVKTPNLQNYHDQKEVNTNLFFSNFQEKQTGSNHWRNEATHWWNYISSSNFGYIHLSLEISSQKYNFWEFLCNPFNHPCKGIFHS